MLRCSAVYLTGTYGATGGARAMALSLPYLVLEHREPSLVCSEDREENREIIP